MTHLRTRGRTGCCHYTLVHSQSSGSSSSPAGKQVPWPEAHKLMFSSPGTLRQSALGGKQYLRTQCGIFGGFPLPALPRHCKQESADAEPVPHHSCTIDQLGRCWCPGCPDDTLLGNDPFLPTVPLFVRTEVTWIGWRNKVGIDFSRFRTTQAMGAHTSGPFSVLPGMNCFLLVV